MPDKKNNIQSKDSKNRLLSFFKHLPFMSKSFVSMLKDFVKGKYKKTPWSTIVSVVVGVLYFIVPIDIIPDFILGFGFIDDAAVLAFCLNFIKKDLDKYQEWKNKNS